MHIDFKKHLPTKVSRFYPLFALTLLIISSVLFYSWQKTIILYSNLEKNVDQREASLKEQVRSLTADKVSNQEKLKQQEETINQFNQKISDLEKDYQAKTESLSAKEALLAKAQSQIDNQNAQLAKNANELEQLRNRPPLFSFQNNSSLTDIETKKAAVKTLVTNAYDYIQDLYGKPYLLNSITITFVDNFEIAGSAGEIVIKNSSQGINIDIHLKDFDPNSFQDCNTVIHEVIHGFHGITVFNSPYEEGITVAATDVVMSKMIKDGKLPKFSNLYIVIDNATYQKWNNIYKIYNEDNAFYSDPNIAKIYQIIGKAWYNLYASDSNIFKTINDKYYTKMQNGQKMDNLMVLDIIRSSISSVGTTPINNYLSDNIAFNPI